MSPAYYSSGLSAPSALSAVNPLTCRIITDVADAETLRLAWTDLLVHSERNELTQTPDWMLNWWRVFGNAQCRQLKLGLFYDGDRLVGLAPLVRRRHWYKNWLPFRRLELLASGEPDADGIYSNHIGILAERGLEAEVAQHLVQAIAAGLFGPWDEVVLPMMSGDTAMPGQLVEAFRSARYAAESTVMAGAPYIPLPAAWREYLQNLSVNSRRNLERSIKAFDKWSAGTTELECISTAGDVERGRNILMSLHHERWSSADQGGVFRSPLFLDFHARMMQALAERGALELLILKARGDPTAVLYSMVWDNKVYAYQTGRRTDMPSNNVRPGSVLFALAIRRAIEHGRREFDLLADEAFYKAQLTPHVRKLVQVRAARRCLVETIRGMGVAVWTGLRRLRRANSVAPPTAD